MVICIYFDHKIKLKIITNNYKHWCTQVELYLSYRNSWRNNSSVIDYIRVYSIICCISESNAQSPVLMLCYVLEPTVMTSHNTKESALQPVTSATYAW
jgi:hypothetical protein